MSAGEFPILIFTDGACSGNPGPGGWGAIIVTTDGQVREIGGGARATTNNQMELLGAIRALEHVRDVGKTVIEVYTDSVYVINGITKWIWGWRKNGWKSKEGKEVLNQDLWKQLAAVTAKLPGIEWKWVKGHAGVPGNDRVDEIAVAFSQNRAPRLYVGPLLGYGLAVHDVPENTAVPEHKPREPKAAAYSYLSLIGDQVERHTSWADCERRVKGRSGAKFKKALSADQELEILAQWGVKPPRG
jgi:ribonuclease HI